MIKLLKYMKPFLLMILLAIALLYGQAMTDLALPDFLAKIVDVGIQQSGNKDVIPVVMRQSDMDQLTIFLAQEDKKILEENYEKLEKETKAYTEIAHEYGQVTDEVLYALIETESGVAKETKETMVKALLAVENIQKKMEAAEGADFQLNGRTVPAGTDVFALLKNMPPSAQEALIKESDSHFAHIGEEMLFQAGTHATLSLYEKMGVDVDKMRQDYIIHTGLIMLGITILGAIASISVGFIAAKVAAGLGKDLRKRIFNQVSRFSNVELDKFSTASLITRSTNDVMQVQTLMVVMIRMVFYAPILGIGGVIKAMDNNASMSWIIALAVGILVSIIAIVLTVAMPKFKLVQKLVDQVNLVMRESLTGIMVIRAFNTQKFEEKRFEKANKSLTDTNLFVNRVMVFLMPFMMFIMNAVMILIVWVGAKEISNSTMQVGDMMAFMQYAMQIIMAFLMMSMVFMVMPRASVAAGRIIEVLETKVEIDDPKEPRKFKGFASGKLTFNHVSFKYPGAEEYMLKDISFIAKSGETTAIIGATGSGKTTLVNLIPRLYDTTEGEIYLDGMDVREVTQHELRKRIGYVPQKVSLFSGTIQSNLHLAKEGAKEEEMMEAIDIAQATEFVTTKEGGLLTHIAQGGDNLSGGQKQRLSIARALIKQPEVCIFDDSFSALDFKTDKKLRQAIKEKMGKTTFLIVAQRISTIKSADQIIVLEDGKMVGKGSHKTLMETCKTYQEIAYSQLPKEALV